MKKIVLCGGGTAGHIMPNIALLPLLRREFDQIHYITSQNGMENTLLSQYKDIILHPIPCTKLVRSLNFKNLLIPFRLCSSVCAAKKVLKSIAPDVIFSKGGFAALPVVLGAGDIPVVAHESDIKMGLANRLCKNKCKYICTTFQTTSHSIKNGVFTGSALREQLFNGNRQAFLSECGFSGNNPVVLITGGSLGATRINDCVKQALAELTAHYRVIHLVGKNNIDSHKPEHNYAPFAFRSDMENAFAAADLVVSRAGSNALSELMALAKPTLAIPLDKGSRGDQIENAAYYESRGMISVLNEQSLSPSSLIAALERLNKNKVALIQRMRAASVHNGTQKIVETILKACK